MASPFDLKSFRQQHLLIEFTALKHVQPQGVYVSLTQGDATQWNGVLFVRKGPYSPAILRFRITFPAAYPYAPPLIIFQTDIFHPLLTPLTTATFSADSSDPEGTAMQDRLPPGAFSLRHAFPQWYPKPSTTHPQQSPSTSPGSPQPANPALDTQAPEQIHVVDILRYVRTAFQDPSALDAVPFSAAGNPGAWYAWQAYRKKAQEKASTEAATPKAPTAHARTPSKTGHARSPSKGTSSSHARTSSRGTNRQNGDTPGRPKRPSEWNWEGVWEQRVKRAVNDSVNEGVLFGSGGLKDDEIRFTDLNQDELREVSEDMWKALESQQALG